MERHTRNGKPKKGLSHVNLTDRALNTVLVGWWRMGLQPLAQVAPTMTFQAISEYSLQE